MWIGGGGVPFEGRRGFLITEGFLARAFGEHANGALYFQPYFLGSYRLAPSVPLEASYLAYVPLNDAGRAQHLLEHVKLEYDFARHQDRCRLLRIQVRRRGVAAQTVHHGHAQRRRAGQLRILASAGARRSARRPVPVRQSISSLVRCAQAGRAVDCDLPNGAVKASLKLPGAFLVRPLGIRTRVARSSSLSKG